MDTRPETAVLDCGREHCKVRYPEAPEHWCRACLLAGLQRMRRGFPASWRSALSHFDDGRGDTY